MQTDHEFITLSEKTQCQVHLTSEKGKPAAVFSPKKKRESSQEAFSDREGVSSGHQSVQGKGERNFLQVL